MALPADGQDANGLTKVTQIPAGKELMFIDPTTNEGGIITLEDLTKQILNGLASQAFALDAGQMTLLAALNKLNSESGIMKVTFSDTDLNQLYEIGSSNTKIYVCVPGTPNIPEEYTGFVIVIRYDNNAKAQLYISLSGKLYFRINTASWNKVESIVL